MLEYITEADYKKLLGKESVPDNFKQLVIEASNYINYKTFGRVDKDNVPEQVQYVTCLIINLQDEENIKLSEIGNLKSQNIEGWSESYSTPEEIKKDYEEQKYEILRENLWNVIGIDGNPLLYSGVN